MGSGNGTEKPGNETWVIDVSMILLPGLQVVKF